MKRIPPLLYPQTFWTRLLRNCVLALRTPICFWLTYGDSLEPLPELRPANQQAYRLGRQLVDKLRRQLTGGMHIKFVGSNALRIIGIHDDIDLLAGYESTSEREKWYQTLISTFGQPTVTHPTHTKWDTTYQGLQIEIVLCHPRSSVYQKAMFAFFALSNFPEVLSQYVALKRGSVGVTQREYNRRQLYFFECMVRDFVEKSTKDSLHLAASDA